jgi:hypothetical protein
MLAFVFLLLVVTVISFGLILPFTLPLVLAHSPYKHSAMILLLSFQTSEMIFFLGACIPVCC